jgi:ABC-type transport system involved in Fe-S cluster assembly fused permease/ATPase subunit
MTSLGGLDFENENHIQSAIEELHGHITILVITHRLSTIQSADAIYVVERGYLVENGDWATLLSKPDGQFKASYAAQRLENEIETAKRW